MGEQYNIQNEIRVGKKRLETIEETYRKSRDKIEETYQSYIDVKDSLQHMVDESHEELFRQKMKRHGLSSFQTWRNLRHRPS